MMSETHKPTAKDRRTVLMMATVGIPQTDISAVIGISRPTLRKHYGDQLTTGPARANTKVGKRLFSYATGQIGTSREQLTAAIFWAKTRMQWHETQRHAGPAGERLIPVPTPGQIVNVYLPSNERDELPRVTQERIGGHVSDNGAGD